MWTHSYVAYVSVTPVVIVGISIGATQLKGYGNDKLYVIHLKSLYSFFLMYFV